MNDTERLNLLEKIIWSNQLGNGLAIFPGNLSSSREKFVSLCDMGDEDGSDLGDELVKGDTLRDAIDAISLEEMEEIRGFTSKN